MSRVKAGRDGFEIVRFSDGKVERFIACTKDGRWRERVEAGLLINLNTEDFCVRDTREGDDD